MQKKNGFTLIELLAVIVILAVIALISTPIIIGVIEKSRKGAFEDSAYGVLDAGKIYFVDKLADQNKFEGASFTFPEGGDLKVSGEKPAGGTLSLDAEGKQAMALYDKDKKWCALKAYNEEKIKIQEYDASTCKISFSASDTIINMGSQQGSTCNGKLYKDTSSSKGYVYKGIDPCNFLVFDDKCWSIIRVEANGEVKLSYEGKSTDGKCTAARPISGTNALERTFGLSEWSSTGASNNWFINAPSSLRKNLESIGAGHSFNGNAIGHLDQVASHTWEVGAISSLTEPSTIEEDMKQIKTQKSQATDWPDGIFTWENKVGLISIIDFVKASSNSACETLKTAVDSNRACNQNNYLTRFPSEILWTMNAQYERNSYVWARAGSAYSSLATTYTGLSNLDDKPVKGYVVPSIYLQSNNVITEGDGSRNTPFILR